MDDSERTFMGGNRNPERFGFSVRASLGSAPDQSVIDRAAVLLGREAFFVDKKGYECELIAAAIHAPTNRVAYVESRAKERRWTSMIDVSIKVHLREADGKDRSVDIESYNPFFGCDVGFFEWIGETAVLIYAEKHDTYVCAFGSEWPPRFIEIENRWVINEGVLGYLGYKQKQLQRLTLPELSQLAPVSLDEAKEAGLLPVDVCSLDEK
ncbi:hypothetical protein [Gimesia chilikensis]|uniref:hypothetical protein n=1 Tax=Gimesia chilikensis TaxID=2605989 RepID=UPI003A9292F8